MKQWNFRKNCEAIRKRRDRLSANVRDSQQNIKSKVIDGALSNVSVLGFQELMSAPGKISRTWEAMLAADREYDRCVPNSLREARKQARNNVRRQSRQNAQRAQQRNQLRDIENTLKNIESRL